MVLIWTNMILSGLSRSLKVVMIDDQKYTHLF